MACSKENTLWPVAKKTNCVLGHVSKSIASRSRDLEREKRSVIKDLITVFQYKVAVEKTGQLNIGLDCPEE